MCRGKPYVNESMKIEDLPESFVSEKAPRTVVALDTNGTLSLIQVTHSTVTGKTCSHTVCSIASNLHRIAYY